MIKSVSVSKAPKDEEVFALFRPYVKDWFVNKFKKFTPPQKLSIPSIHLGKNTLVTAPTGSGKTISAFGAVLNDLFKLAEKKELKDEVYCVYISPLKALINDINRNLLEPLEEIKDLAKKNYKLKLDVRVGIRTGDTETKERTKQLRKPPHILCTTPETLAILLSTLKFKEKLKSVKYIVIDEIHELANSKRGAHLSLSLERLQNLTEGKLIRIGLGATIEPLEEVAKYLVGYENNEVRDCIIVDGRFSKKIDIKILSPVQDLLYTDAEEINSNLYEYLDKMIRTHTTTLIFTNTRSGTERIVHHLKETFSETYTEDEIGAHHSSVSKNIRLELEEKLKQGKLKVIVSSTSLELGIDIGYVDLVIQIGSPKSVARGLQRIGRSNHQLSKTSKGRIICLDRDDLIETNVLFKKANEFWLDRIYIVKNALDVLSQQIVGLSLENKWYLKDAYELIKKSYCYKDLDYETYMQVIKYLAGEYHTLQEKHVYGKIWYDELLGQFGKRGRLARMIYSMNIGTIPDEVKIKVKTTKGDIVGTIEEEFLSRLSKGDIFVLAGKTYQFSRSLGMTAMVIPLKDKKPTVPSWFSEQLPLNHDLALEIGKFRDDIFKLNKLKSKSDVKTYLLKNYLMDDHSAKAISDYFYYQQKFLDTIKAKSYPSDKTLLVETYIDEGGNKNYIFHALYGRRVNDALSRALGFILSRNLGRSIPITINDNGFILTVHAKDIGFTSPYELFKSLREDNFYGILRLALKQTELLKRKFRNVSSRALMILRNYRGYENSAGKQQMSADRLFKICDAIEDFPIITETYREIMQDYMDIDSAINILTKIKNNEIKLEVLQESNLASPFAHNLLVLSDADIVLMDDRKKILLDLHKKIIDRVGN